MKLSPLSALAAAILCLSATGLAPLPALAQQSGAKAEDKPFRLQTALDLPDWLKVSGSIRPRYESLANQFVAGRTGGDDYFAVQSLLKVEATVSRDFIPDFVIGGELEDVRLLSGDAGGQSPQEIDTLEPLQMYLSWRPKNLFLTGDALDITAGRFTMDVGGRRILARSNMRNPLQAFDGVRALWTHSNGTKVLGFYTSPVNRLPTDVQSVLGNDSEFNQAADAAFYGVNAETPLVFGAIGEAYFYGLKERDAANQPTRNRDLNTSGVRLRKPQKKSDIDFEFEYAWQTGTNRATTAPADVTNLHHEANMFHGEVGYTLALPWTTRVSLHYDLISGDERPADSSDERFDPLFGDRAFELGPTGIWGLIGRTNLDSPGVRLEVKPDGRNELMISVRNVRLDSARDSFGNAGVRDATGASGKEVGEHWELRWRHQVVPNSIRLAIGFAGLNQGHFMEAAPNRTGQGNPWYGFSEVTFSF
jgi:Alginate export